MSRLSRLKLLARLCNLGPKRMWCDPWSDSCPDIPDILSRPSRLKFSAQLCNLGLNPDAARPVARFMSRLSRPYDKTFKIQTLGATMPFGSKSRCGATLGATHVQIFQTLCPDFPDSNSWRDSAIWVQNGCGATLGATHVQTFQTFCPDLPDSNSRRNSAIWA